jgi:hypothetical protein
MANRKKRVIIDNEKGSIVYESEMKDVVVFNDNGRLYFESSNPILGEDFKSYDCAEGVAALMKLRTVFDDEKFWNLKVGNSKYDVSSERALYWLSGGNREWKQNDTYAYEWVEVHSIFEHKFRDIVYEIVENAETLKDIKEGFLVNLNLPVLYEFALGNDLI